MLKKIESIFSCCSIPRHALMVTEKWKEEDLEEIKRK